MNNAFQRHSFSGMVGRDSQFRWPLMIAAGAFGGFALLRRTPWSAALAGAGLWAVQSAARHAQPQTRSARASFAINCTAEQAYSTWKDFGRLSRFLRHVHSVKALDESHSEWVIDGPFEKKFRWVANIVEDRPNERIAWESVPGSAVETRGVIEFRPRTSGRGIVVTASMEYAVVAGGAVQGLFTVLGHSPQFTLREDLRRFKALLEAGEVPTVAGQPHGPRGLRGAMYRHALREKQNETAPQAQMAEPRIA